MTDNIVATYKVGNSTVNIIAPDANQEEVKKEMKRVGWELWNSFSTEKKLEINKKYE